MVVWQKGEFAVTRSKDETRRIVKLLGRGLGTEWSCWVVECVNNGEHFYAHPKTMAKPTPLELLAVLGNTRHGEEHLDES